MLLCLLELYVVGVFLSLFIQIASISELSHTWIHSKCFTNCWTVEWATVEEQPIMKLLKNKALKRLFNMLSVTVLLVDIALSDTTKNFKVVTDKHGVHMCAEEPNKIIKLVRSPIACSGKCSSENDCVGFNFRSRSRVCELFIQPGPTEKCIEDDCSYYTVSNCMSLVRHY